MGWSNTAPATIIVGGNGQTGQIIVLRADGTKLATLDQNGLDFYDSTGTNIITSINDNSEIISTGTAGTLTVFESIIDFNNPSYTLSGQVFAEPASSSNGNDNLIAMVSPTTAADGSEATLFLQQNASSGLSIYLGGTTGTGTAVNCPIFVSGILTPFNLSSQAPEMWNRFPYVNSWKDFGGAFSSGGYRIDAFGRVWLRGAIQNSGTITDGSIICTLPAGYRPPAETEIPVASGRAGQLLPKVIITSAGVMSFSGIGTSSPADGLCILECSFSSI